MMRFQVSHITYAFLFLMLVNLLSSCKTVHEETAIGVDYDPNKSIVFSEYAPKEGPVRTNLFIRGDNFGTEASKIRVYIGERELKVIGSDGKQIYCMVPRHTRSGEVKVIIDHGTPVEHTFNEEFTYVPTLTVGTLVGDVDELGRSSIVDGTFEEARFDFATWLMYEPISNSIFVTERDRAVRVIDLNEQTVRTLITNGQASFKKMQTSALSFDKDTLFIVDDNGQNNKTQVAIAYTLRSENFRRVHPYIYDRTAYACASHPVDNIMFYNTYWGGGIQKAYPDPVTGEMISKELFKVGGSTNMKPNIFFHPSGNYAYLMVERCIWKSMYNWETKELMPPIVFAGGYGSSFKGDVDAIGTSARFGYLNQGVFAKNPDYEGQEDEYDFYVADIDNHSIRKITPTAQVSTFAGKGSPSIDDEKKGYIDGDLRLEARFNKPNGITYDEENQIFYISEEVNKRIRTIRIE